MGNYRGNKKISLFIRFNEFVEPESIRNHLNMRILLALLFITVIAVNVSCSNKEIDYSDKNENENTPELPALDIEYMTAIQGINTLTNLHKHFYSHPGELNSFCESAAESVNKSASSPSELFHYAFQIMGTGAGGYGPPLPGIKQKHCFTNIDETTQFLLNNKVAVENLREWNKLPFEIQKFTVEFLSAAMEAKFILDDFCTPILEKTTKQNPVQSEALYEILKKPWITKEMTDFSSIDIIECADLRKLSYATRILATKLNTCINLNSHSDLENFSGCRLKTPLGDIILNGKKPDTTTNSELLIIDLGGNDYYTGNIASASYSTQPFSFLIDLSGDDIYNAESLASAVLGIAALFDLQGNDKYYTKTCGPAYSLYGSSIVYDKGGDDIYFGENENGQASAYVGVSFLADLSGDDQYTSGAFSQGFGSTLGAGIFYDRKGNDEYNSLQLSPGFVLGAARGRWAEATDGHSLAGGTGIFIDYSGNDRYSAGSFSIGGSYYFGLGAFYDESGDDSYNALSHSFGYAAHFSLAGFHDNSGDDIYNGETIKEKITQSMGCGRDLSAGVFREQSGDDEYHFGNRSAGIGDLKGIGSFTDYSGDDEYHWHKNRLNELSPSMGAITMANQQMQIGYRIYVPDNFKGVGTFNDTNGKDKYFSYEQNHQ